MAIVCPKCGGKTTVVNSRTVKNEQHKRRLCAACGTRFSTVEKIVRGSVTCPKNDDPPLTLEEIQDLYEKFGLM